MRLYIVRHGETVGNVKKITQGWMPGKLTKLGKEQAKKLANRLAKENIDMIYCSDLNRCGETVEPFLRLKRNIPIYYVKDLRERDWGIFEGKKYETGRKWIKENKLKIDDKIPKGESFSDVEKRMVKFFNKIFKEHKGKNVLFVTHGGAKKILITFLLNRQHKRRHKRYHSENTALTIINLKENGKHKARLINSTRHLEER
jgi:broad specificity phosphatase PhoE